MSGYVEANWAIPHCEFKTMPDGFRVSFTKRRQTSGGEDAVTISGGALLIIVMVIAAVVAGFEYGLAAALALVVAAFIGVPVLYYLIAGSKITTVIEVTPDAIVVNGNRLRRSDFGGFRINNTEVGAMAVIGFRYGNMNAPVGGLWQEREAIEFVSALNSYLRVAERAGNDKQVSPETLRAARPSEF